MHRYKWKKVLRLQFIYTNKKRVQSKYVLFMNPCNCIVDFVHFSCVFKLLTKSTNNKNGEKKYQKKIIWNENERKNLELFYCSAFFLRCIASRRRCQHKCISEKYTLYKKTIPFKTFCGHIYSLRSLFIWISRLSFALRTPIKNT